MGLSFSKSFTKPIYGSQITGAADAVTSAYNTAAPKISAATDALGSLTPGLVEQFTKGDPNVNAASGYNLDVLGGKYLTGNPQLDAMVQTTNRDARNGVQASLGTRGLTGGSSYADLVTRALADNETKLRYGDYSAERSRMDGAASLAPTLSAARYQPIGALSDIIQAQLAPVQAASGMGSAIGGLLGQYTKQKQSGNVGQLLGGLGGAALSGWAGGGF